MMINFSVEKEIERAKHSFLLYPIFIMSCDKYNMFKPKRNGGYNLFTHTASYIYSGNQFSTYAAKPTPEEIH